MAAIITTHISMNETAALSQVCPILIQAIDIVQSPGMTMPPDMDLQLEIVSAPLAMNKSRLAPRKTRSRRRLTRPSRAEDSYALTIVRHQKYCVPAPHHTDVVACIQDRTVAGLRLPGC